MGCDQSNGQKENAAILLPLFSIFLILFYQYMSEAVINLIKEKKLNRLTETWQSAVIKKLLLWITVIWKIMKRKN